MNVLYRCGGDHPEVPVPLLYDPCWGIRGFFDNGAAIWIGTADLHLRVPAPTNTGVGAGNEGGLVFERGHGSNGQRFRLASTSRQKSGTTAGTDISQPHPSLGYITPAKFATGQRCRVGVLTALNPGVSRSSTLEVPS
jgi:hypothetical protein